MESLLNSVPLPALALLTIGAGLLVAVVFRKEEDRLIAERKHCSNLGKLFGQYGHTIAAGVLQDLAIGDLPDALKTIQSTLKTLSSPTAGPAAMQADMLSQLNCQLTMPSAAPAILKAVAGFAANPANAAVVKAAGLAIVAAV
jgi:hypothetical protein